MKELFDFILDRHQAGMPVVLATVISTSGSVPGEPGKKMAVAFDGTTVGTVGGGVLEAETIEAAQKVMEEGSCRRLSFELDQEKAGGLGMLCGGKQEVFLDLLAARSALVIFGGGHVGLALANLAALLGFSYSVVDDRADFVSPERFPSAFGRYVVDFEQPWEELPVDRDSFVVIMTRGHSYDLECLRQALSSPARYIGMIGSKKKCRAIIEALDQEGLNASSDPRVYSPIGLELGDDSPEEIALSIMAEIVAVKSGGSARHLREKV